MELTSIVRVQELCDFAEVNHYLEMGWVYLGQASYASGTPDARIAYSLGWSSENGNIRYPDAPARKELN